MADRDAIIRKLKKMAAKAGSLEELGSEAEAATFAEIMQRLAADHQIDLAELREEEQQDVDPMDRVQPNYVKHGVKVRRRHVGWLQTLAVTVAYAHYCRLLVVPGTSIVVFAGRRSQAQAAADVYLKLVNVAESLADKEYVKFFHEMKRAGDETRARGFRTSFLVGFCGRIGTRYADWMEALKEYYAHDKRALVVLKESHDKVDDWLEEQKVKKSTAQHKGDSVTNLTGWSRGKSKADDVDLSGHKKIS